MSQYFIKTVDTKDFSQANTAELNNFQWIDTHYHPVTKAWVIFEKGCGFHVRMRSYETNPRATFTKYMDPVCDDSCMEFFVNFNPQKGNGYINFEANPLGTVNCTFGDSRYDRRTVESICSSVPKVTATIKEDYWEIEYFLGLDWLEKIFGKFSTQKGTVYRANFYKCADKFIYPHYGTWFKVQCDIDEFHCPDLFGELVMD